jgi:non-canonical purine NTP pyrophosphatase (RdgB/HAM1 family)
MPPNPHTLQPAAIVLATGNPHKVAELRDILAGAGVPVLALTDLPEHARLHEPEEPGQTFRDNARIKALSYAEQIAKLPATRAALPAGAVVIADDSGIEIDALALADGTPRPGVISSHYCTDGREVGMSRAERDAANNARVLRELTGVTTDRRGARFVCCMCVASVPEHGSGKQPEVRHESRGTMEGRIGEPPRVPSGGNGFGYDPLFLVRAEPFGFERTGAELLSAEKNGLSHRGAAGRGLAEWIGAWRT